MPLPESEICELWTQWRANEIAPNTRQLKILELWEAVLDEGDGDFDKEVIKIPNHLSKLWKLCS